MHASPDIVTDHRPDANANEQIDESVSLILVQGLMQICVQLKLIMLCCVGSLP